MGVRRGRPGCGAGVATAVVYGVMVLVASLPGALVLVGGMVPPYAALTAAHGARAGRRAAGRSRGCVTARTPC